MMGHNAPKVDHHMLATCGIGPHIHIGTTWWISLPTFSSMAIFLQIHSCGFLGLASNILLFLWR